MKKYPTMRKGIYTAKDLPPHELAKKSAHAVADNQAAPPYRPIPRITKSEGK